MWATRGGRTGVVWRSRYWQATSPTTTLAVMEVCAVKRLRARRHRKDGVEDIVQEDTARWCVRGLCG